MLSEVLHRGNHATAPDLHTGQLEPHLATGQCGQQCQVAAVTQVADTEHPALQLPESGAERQIEALVNQSTQGVSVNANRGHDSGQNRRVALRIDALQGQSPG